MEEPKGLIRSKESNIRSFVRFTNCSERNIEVHWIDYRGQNIHYKNLNPTESCVVYISIYLLILQLICFLFLDQYFRNSSMAFYLS